MGSYSKDSKTWGAPVRILFVLIRKAWPASASSKKTTNFIKRWPATVRVLLPLIREGGPARASSKKRLISIRRGRLQLA